MHRMVVLVCVFVALASPPRAAAAQVEMDRIVSRVSGRIITQSDVQQARRLKLVEDVSSDVATLRALETRLLVLGEMMRGGNAPPPSEAEIAIRRTEWQTALGGAAAAADMLGQAGMNETELNNWLRDDVRMHAYLQRQFGMLADAERARAINDWTARLRSRANLGP